MATQKELNKELIAAISKGDIAEINDIIERGASVNANASKAIFIAAKLLRLDVIESFIHHDSKILNSDAIRHISHICDMKGFSDANETQFFRLISYCIMENSDPLLTITPYVNTMAAVGRLDKILAAQNRYYLTEPEIANIIKDRIIFEAIDLGFESVATFVSKHRDWMTQNTLDTAVECGDWLSLEYILNHGKFHVPSVSSVAKALFNRYFEVLDILVACGYSFNKNPVFLCQACKSALVYGAESIEYLFKRGYSALDRYNSKSIRENAIIDGNKNLLDYLDKNQQ